MMLQYSAIIRELLVVQKAMERVLPLLEGDDSLMSHCIAGTILDEVTRFKMSLEQQEVQEDPDREE